MEKMLDILIYYTINTIANINRKGYVEDKDIPKIISQLGESLELTQEELADKLEVSSTTLHRWENVKIVPRTKTKDKILYLIESSGFIISDSGIKCKRKTSKEDVLSTKAMEQML